MSSVQNTGGPLNTGGPEAQPLPGGTSFAPLTLDASRSVAETLHASHPPTKTQTPQIPVTAARKENPDPQSNTGTESSSLRSRPEIHLEETDSQESLSQTSRTESSQSTTGSQTLPVVPKQNTASSPRVHFEGETQSDPQVTLQGVTKEEKPERHMQKAAMAKHIALLGGVGLIYSTVWAVPAACMTVGWLLHGAIDKVSSENGSWDTKGLAENIFKPFVTQSRGLIAASEGYKSYSEMEKAKAAEKQQNAVQNTSTPSTTQGAVPTSTTPPINPALKPPVQAPHTGESEAERAAREQRERGTASTTNPLPSLQPPQTTDARGTEPSSSEKRPRSDTPHPHARQTVVPPRQTHGSQPPTT